MTCASQKSYKPTVPTNESRLQSQNNMSVIVKRLKPGDDLRSEIESLVQEIGLRAGVLLSIVGSLKEANIRLANHGETTKLDGPLEIVSGTGTVSDSGLHIHLSVSDFTGKTSGGHLQHGCTVHTTVELVIQDLSGEWIFDRQPCVLSGYKELVPKELGRGRPARLNKATRI